MKEVKAIAFDMDGTLLIRDENGEDHIGSKTKEVLLRAQKAGIRLILASGRAYPKLLPYARELQMDKYGGWLVEINGTAVYDLQKEQRRVFHQLHREEIMDLFEKCKAMEFEMCASLDDTLYCYIPQRLIPINQAYVKALGLADDVPLTAGAFALVYDNRKGYPHQYFIQEASELPLTMNKLCVTDEPERLPLVNDLLQEYQGKLWWGATTPRWLEILPIGVNKGEGVRHCCEQMGIDPQEVMAFGDGENDIDMLRVCGYGYAMGNALDSVKRIAYDVCDNNRNEGPAKVIEQMLDTM